MKISKISFPAALCLGLLLAPPVWGETAQYTYDILNRLIQVQYDNGTTIQYTYDQMGNRLTRQVTAFSFGVASGAPLQSVVPAGAPRVSEVASAPPQPFPEVGVFLERLGQVDSEAEAERLRDEFFTAIDNSDLSPEDKDSYKEQVSRKLEEKQASLDGKSQAARVQLQSAAPDLPAKEAAGKEKPAQARKAPITKQGAKISNLSAGQPGAGSTAKGSDN